MFFQEKLILDINMLWEAMSDRSVYPHPQATQAPAPHQASPDSGRDAAQPPLAWGFGLSKASEIRARAHRAATRGPRARALLHHGSRLGLRRRLLLPLQWRFRVHAAAMPAPARGVPGLQLRRKCGGGARALMGSAAQSGLRFRRRRQWRLRGL